MLKSLLLTAIASGVLVAQNPAGISQFFEGKKVVVQVDMPASQTGVDIYPQRSQPMDLNSYSRHVKQYGIALRSGESVMVTKVKVKDKVVEFQLGGGGYGTFTDESASSGYTAPLDKSNREKDLEKRLSSTSDAEERKRISRELDDARRDRERIDQRNRIEGAREAEASKQRIEIKRLQGGSRFNLRYEPRIPADLSPEAIMTALAQYVTFPPEGFLSSSSKPAAVPVSANSIAPDTAGRTLRKGMTKEEVDALLGRPVEESARDESGLQMKTCVYNRNDESIRAEFVNGVLVRYVASSR